MEERQNLHLKQTKEVSDSMILTEVQQNFKEGRVQMN